MLEACGGGWVKQFKTLFHTQVVTKTAHTPSTPDSILQLMLAHPPTSTTPKTCSKITVILWNIKDDRKRGHLKEVTICSFVSSNHIFVRSNVSIKSNELILGDNATQTFSDYAEWTLNEIKAYSNGDMWSMQISLALRQHVNAYRNPR